MNTAPWQPGRAYHHGHTQPQQFAWCACHATISPPRTHWRTTRGHKTQYEVETPSREANGKANDSTSGRSTQCEVERSQ